MLPREEIHFKPDCTHRETVLATVWLRTLQARVTRNYAAVSAAIRALDMKRLTPLHHLQLGMYLVRNEFGEGVLNCDNACQELLDIAERVLAADVPDEDRSQVRRLAADMIVEVVIMYAHEGRFADAQTTLVSYLKKCGDQGDIEALYKLASSIVDYAEFGDADRVVPMLQDAVELARPFTKKSCLLKAVVMPLALMLAKTGNGEAARQKLVSAELPLDKIPPFGEWPVELEDMLRWYAFTQHKAREQ